MRISKKTIICFLGFLLVGLFLMGEKIQSVTASDHDEAEEKALLELIDQQKKLGADVDTMPERYEWYNGHLVSIQWHYGVGKITGDISFKEFPELTTLELSGSITTLDISQNFKLKKLNCQSTGLEKLDLSHNTLLTELDCSQNQLRELDLTNNSQLQRLNCSDNKLNKLDLSLNTMLESVYCNENLLHTLDVSKNTKLEIFNCTYNILEKLDLTKNEMLKDLWCDFSWEQLDLRQNIYLESVNEEYYDEEGVWALKSKEYIESQNNSSSSASPSPTASPIVSEKPETSMTPMPSPSVTPAATPTPTSTPTQASDIEPTKQPNDNSNASNRQPLQTASPSKQPYQTETIRLQKPALGKITLTKAAYPIIRWNKVNTASGYEVWRVIGNKKAFKKLHTVSGKAVCRYIDSKARSGQKYRYRIRAFYKKGSKISYSAYSRIKEIGTYLLKKPLIRGGSGKTADGRSYVWISLKRYAGNRIQIYYRIKKGKWIRLKLVTDRIPKKNSRFMILCKRKYKIYDFQVRTHEKRKGKKQYSPLSNVTRIFMEKKE